MENSTYGTSAVNMGNNNNIVTFPGVSALENTSGEDLYVKLAKFHHWNDKGAKGVFDHEICEYLSKREHIFVFGGTPYLYKDGVYRPDPDGKRIKEMIKELILPEFIKYGTIERVYKLLLLDKRVSDMEINQYPESWICFKNGIYDPIEGKMMAYEPEYRIINQLDVEYHPEDIHESGVVKEWLSSVLDDDDREMLLQYCGYCMTRDTNQQRFLVLCGAAGSGKSTLIRLLESVIGDDNISNISLAEINQRFASFGLVGKLVNSCADLEVKALEDTSLVKKLLGEDRIRVEGKGKNAVSYRNYAKMIFSTNELPIIRNERSDGFFRRLLVLEMNKLPEQKDIHFLSKLLNDRASFVHMCVKALERLNKSQEIHVSENSKRCGKELRYASDSVEEWLDDNCVKDTEARTERKNLFENYRCFCASEGEKSMKAPEFYRALQTKGFPTRKYAGIRKIVGLKIKEKAVSNE